MANREVQWFPVYAIDAQNYLRGVRNYQVGVYLEDGSLAPFIYNEKGQQLSNPFSATIPGAYIGADPGTYEIVFSTSGGVEFRRQKVLFLDNSAVELLREIGFFPYLIGNDSSFVESYQYYPIKVGYVVRVNAVDASSDVMPSDWRCTADNAPLPSGAIPGELHEGVLYLLNSGSDYYKFEYVGEGRVDEQTDAVVTLRDDLLDTSSPLRMAALVGFKARGVEAVARDILSKAREIETVYDYGAIGGMVHDDTAGIQKAIGAVGARGGGIVWLLSKHKVTEPLVNTYGNVYLASLAPRGSEIAVFHDDGAALTVEAAGSPGSAVLNNFGMFGVSMRARIPTTNGCLLRLNNVGQFYASNLSLEDHFGGMHVSGGLQHYINNFNIGSPRQSGDAAWTAYKPGSFFYKVDRASGGRTPTELFVSNFNFRRSDASNFVEHGIVVNAVDGLWMSNGHVMGVYDADFRVEPVNGDEQITGILLSNFWFDNNSAVGLGVYGNTSHQYGRIELCPAFFLGQTNASIFVDAEAVDFQGVHYTGGWVHKSERYGALIRAGRRHIFSSVEFGACNTDGAANTAAISIDGDAGTVNVDGCHFIKSALGVTSNSMIGVRVSQDVTTRVNVKNSDFDLVAADIDRQSGTNPASSFTGNTTTKSATAGSVSGSSLIIGVFGDQFYVSNGLNFDNMVGRWNDREVTLVFEGVSTVTHSATGGIRLASGANFVTKAGDCLTLLYQPTLGCWVEKCRMVS